MTTGRQAGLPDRVQEQLQQELEAERAGLLRQIDGLAAEADIHPLPRSPVRW